MLIYPEYISLRDFAASLFIDYPNEQIPILEGESPEENEKWIEWGAIVASTGIFFRAGVPSPSTIINGKKTSNFKNWQEWARIMYISMINAQTIEHKHGK